MRNARVAGGVAEWSIAAVLKTAKAKHLRGFESLPLRQIVEREE
jgi:hypothetical protein